jgi:glycosyltransferase involved in cell wall biosynthesis
MKINKILILSTHSEGGGAGLAAYNLYKAMRSSGIDVDFIYLDVKKSWLDKLYYYTSIIFDRLVKQILSPDNKIFHSSSLWGKVKANNINQSDYDIVHVHWVSNGLISLNEISKIKKPLVITHHDSWFACGFEHHPKNNIFSKNLFDRFLLKKKEIIISKASRLIFPSEWQKAIFQQVYQKIPLNYVVPNIVFTKARDDGGISLKKQSKSIRIGVCCQRALENVAKGSEYLIRLIEYLNFHQDENVVEFVIAGKYSRNFNYVRERARNVTIIELGPQSQCEMNSFYAGIDVFLNLSLIENLSTTIIEASAFSIPTIAFNTGGNSEVVINEITGLLIDIENFEMELAKVVQFIKDREKHLFYGASARCRYLNLFEPSLVSKKHLEIYEHAANRS